MRVASGNAEGGGYNTTGANGTPVAGGPTWLGYYRSQNSGSGWGS